MAQTVVGIFDSARVAQDAVERLVSKGISRDQIDLSIHGMGSDMSSDQMRSDSSLSGSSLHDTSDVNSSYARTNTDVNSGDTRYNERNWNDNDDDGFGEKVSRFFRNLFGDDDDQSNKYASVGRDNSIVTVHANSLGEAEEVANLLDEYGAVDVDEKYREYTDMSRRANTGIGNTTGADYLTSERSKYTSQPDVTIGTSSDTDMITDRDDDLTSSRTTTAVGSDLSSEPDLTLNRDTDLTSDRDDDTTRSIPVIEEELQVGKREVNAGSVRVRSRIIERPVEESLRLREERIRVQRTPVNRPATERDLANFQEGEIELTQRAEVPVVNKEARVVEEVNLNRDVREREEVIRDTVRKTEVDVDDQSTDPLNNRNTTTRDNDI